MRRFMLTQGCCLAALVLIAAGLAAAEPESDAPKPKPDASKPEPTAPKPQPDAKKPEATKPKAEQPKPKPEAAKPEAKQPKPKPEAAEKKPAAEKPATHTVKPELLKIEVSLKGNFVAQSMSEIVVRPEAWASFKVVKAVDHGAAVQRGDVLAQFETEDIDKAIADQRAKLELAEVALAEAGENLKFLESSTPLDLASAERTKRMADEDYRRYLKVDRPLSVKSANFSVESSQNYLDYEKEELRQLEKMYKADDLTEETEEIILRRQRDAVKQQEHYLGLAKNRADETLNVTLPRLDESMKQSTQRMEFSRDKSTKTLPLALKRARLELDQLKVQKGKDDERLKDLLADREMMVIKAPAEGVVYYGQFKRGEWSGASSVAEKLEPGASITPKSVFMTVVKPRPMFIRIMVPEKNLHQFRTGLKGTVNPTGYPDLKLDATVTAIDAVPITAGSFEASLRINLDGRAEALMPGMSCNVKFVPYLKRNALTVPPSAVHTDELDEEKHYVCLLTKDGEQKKRSVTIGKKTEDKVEILVGVEAGDEVLKEFPKDKR